MKLLTRPLQQLDANGGVLSPPFPVLHVQLLCLTDIEGEVVVPAPQCQVSDLLPVGCLIVASDLPPLGHQKMECGVQLRLRRLCICWGGMQVGVCLG